MNGHAYPRICHVQSFFLYLLNPKAYLVVTFESSGMNPRKNHLLIIFGSLLLIAATWYMLVHDPALGGEPTLSFGPRTPDSLWNQTVGMIRDSLPQLRPAVQP